jgi:hypothetical protein
MMARADESTGGPSLSGYLAPVSAPRILSRDSAGATLSSMDSSRIVPRRARCLRGEIETPLAIESSEGMGA